MNRVTIFLAACLLAARPGAADVAPVPLDGMHSVDNLKEWTKNKNINVEDGPGAQDPVMPEHLANRHMDELIGMFQLDSGEFPPEFPQKLTGRVLGAVGLLDMFYKAPISEQEWDKRLQEMQEDFVREHGTLGQMEAQPNHAMTGKRWEMAVNGMLERLYEKTGDLHTKFMSPEKAASFSAEFRGFSGIGAKLVMENGAPKIDQVFPDSPAKKAGLRRDDIILAVDGVSTRGQSLKTVTDNLRHGPEGTEVKVLISRLSDPVTVVRGAVNIPDVFGMMIDASWSGIPDVRSDIGYVYVNMFSLGSDERAFHVIDDLRGRGATKLILDLRDNGGGNMWVADSLAAAFLREGDVIDSINYAGKLAQKASVKKTGPYSEMPLAVLIDGASASASEIFTAAMMEHQRAVVVGVKSFGKGTFQVTKPVMLQGRTAQGPVIVEDGSVVKITRGGWYTPQGRSIDGEGRLDEATGRIIPGPGGLHPDIVVTTSEEEEGKIAEWSGLRLIGEQPAPVKDPVVEAAVKALDAR